MIILLVRRENMSVSSSSSPSTYSYPTRLISIDPRIYCETINELHSYLTSCKRGYLTQAELFRYYRQRHDNAEIPYRLLGYKSLLDLLSSDQRLFALDLRREPAHIYSAVKLRQQKREQQQNSPSLTRQHHSTNTVDEQQQYSNNDYIFFDHHVPLNEKQSEDNCQTKSEQDIYNRKENSRPLTPINSNDFDKKLWHTPELEKEKCLIETNQSNSCEENNQDKFQFQSNPFLPLPNSPLFIKSDNQFVYSNNDFQLNQRSILKDPSIVSCSSNVLNRSISTSTTSLSNRKSSSSKNFSQIIFVIFVCLFLFFVYLYKTCFI